MLLPSPQSNTFHVKPDHRYSVIVQNSIYDITVRTCEITINVTLMAFNNHINGIVRNLYQLLKQNKTKHRTQTKEKTKTVTERLIVCSYYMTFVVNLER